MSSLILKNDINRLEVGNIAVGQVGHAYTLKCEDGVGAYYGAINKKFIAGGNTYSRMEARYDDIFGDALFYGSSVAWSVMYNGWTLDNQVIFLEPLTNEEETLLSYWMFYSGTDDGVINGISVDNKIVIGGTTDWGRTTCHEYYGGNINTPLYEIPVFQPGALTSGVYCFRLKHFNNILANFTMVIPATLPANTSIYSTPCYCPTLSKMVMLRMTHHYYTYNDGDNADLTEEAILIHVVDMSSITADLTGSLIGTYAFDWVYEVSINPECGGLEYIQLK